MQIMLDIKSYGLTRTFVVTYNWDGDDDHAWVDVTSVRAINFAPPSDEVLGDLTEAELEHIQALIEEQRAIADENAAIDRYESNQYAREALGR